MMKRCGECKKGNFSKKSIRLDGKEITFTICSKCKLQTFKSLKEATLYLTNELAKLYLEAKNSKS